MYTSKTVLTLCIFLFIFRISKPQDIEIIQSKIISILEKNNPLIIPEFNNFCTQYHQSIVQFFDTTNNEPLTLHIARIENELLLLKQTYSDIRFNSVQPILLGYHQDITKLVHVLKNYVGSTNSISLAWHVQQFKSLLPQPIKDRGNYALFMALKHRLACTP